MQHLGGADPVDDPHAGGAVEVLPHRPGQVLAGRDAPAQAAQRLTVAGEQQRPVHRRRREQHRHAKAGDHFRQLAGRGALQQQGAGTDAERKHHQGAEPEREADRRGAQEQVVRARLEHMAAERVLDSQHIAVEVHGGLGPAGGARGRGEQRDVVGRGSHGGETGVPALAAADQVVAGIAAVPDRRYAEVRGLQFGAEMVIADGQARPGEVGQRRDLTGPQQRHGRHRDPARLDHREPGGDQPRVVGPAQQHPVARHQAEILDKHPGGLVGVAEQVAVGPRLGGGAQAGAIRAEPGDSGVQQRLGAVQPVGITQPAEVKAQVRPLFGGREVVPAEGIDVGGGRQLHCGPSSFGTRRGGVAPVFPVPDDSQWTEIS